MTSSESAIKAYIQARRRFEAALAKYIAECKAQGRSTVVLTEDYEPFSSLSETLLWGFSLLAQKDADQADQNDAFVLGLKYIYNIAKHEKAPFHLFSICHPGVQLSVRVLDTDDGPVIQDASMEPELLFGDANDITQKKQWVYQRKCYMEHIKGHFISEILGILDEKLSRLYPNDIVFPMNA